MNFGEKLKKLRLSKGLTQVQLEQELGLGNGRTGNNIFKYEHNHRIPGPITISKIESYFNVKFQKDDFKIQIKNNNTNTNKNNFPDDSIEIPKEYLDILNSLRKHGYSQRDLSNSIGFTQAIVSNIERGQKNLSKKNFELLESFIKGLSEAHQNIKTPPNKNKLTEILEDIKEFNSMSSGHRLALYAIKEHLNSLHGEIDKFFTDVLSETEKFIMLKALLEYKFGSRPKEEKIQKLIEENDLESAKLGLLFILNNINAQYKTLN